MAWIELTDIDGNPVFINLDHVESIRPTKYDPKHPKEGTWIDYADDYKIVREPYLEVRQQIDVEVKDARETPS